MSDNLKLGLVVLAGLAGVIYAEAQSMNMSMFDTVRQLGADLLNQTKCLFILHPTQGECLLYAYAWE
ncbi:hypothetical protein [Cupriavidus oxalaticus]|uniref:Uncharacterized protein n=1 Tax=Cupriavidus oxalaticus TaxID=96344 RepID=A0A4P7LL33_9BURK|nr:hypothetical protein [Cupriavidus oxalaticus]QBY55519.1 hypothetical protein E0W60_31390 [Cupriavidus oxalaticus]